MKMTITPSMTSSRSNDQRQGILLPSGSFLRPRRPPPAATATATPAGNSPPPVAQRPAVDVSAAIAKALRDDRERILAVLESPEAVGRERSARQLACNSPKPAVEIRALLATMRLDAEPDPREVDAWVKSVVDQAHRRRR